MPCYKPLNAWRLSGNTSEKRKVVFKKPESYSAEIQLPCNMCIGCRLDRSLMWAIRCVHEAQQHTQNCFITLTYSDDHLPSDGSLTHLHFQHFMKRLRRQFNSLTIRYYMCGEYGDKFSRPHYHACLFGIDFPDKEIWDETEGILTFISPTLTEIWGHGHCTLGELNFHTAAYTARYITKKITGDQAQDHYQTTCPHTGNPIQLEPEYCTMSRRPGVGISWFRKYVKDVYPSDYIVHKGHRVKTPRFYDNQLTEEGLAQIKQARKEYAKLHKRENTPERLAVREKVKLLKYQQLTRSYEQ